MNHDRILLTGATGFLGSSLLKALVDSGYEVAIIHRSKSNFIRLNSHKGLFKCYNIDQISIKDCLYDFKPDIIVHCATDYGRKKSDPSEIIDANLILPLKLLELCRSVGVKAFVNTDTFLDKGINYYTLSKKQYKEWLETFASDLVCVNVLLEHFYGAGDDQTKFVSYVINMLLNNVDRIDLTPGLQMRDFIYIKDVVKAFLLIISKVASLENGLYEFGIGTNHQIAIKDLVNKIKEITGNCDTNLAFGALPYRKNEVMKSVIDTSNIRALGWTTKYTLDEGLNETIDIEKRNFIK